MSPTARSLQHLKDLGYHAKITPRLFVVFVVWKHSLIWNTFDIVQHGIQGFLLGVSAANKICCAIDQAQIGLCHKLSDAFSVEVLENSDLDLPGKRRDVTFRVHPCTGTEELVKGHGPQNFAFS
jgi:hypothetical protein